MLFVVLLICVQFTFSAIITDPPQDVTTLVDDTAVFDCTGEGDLLKWSYNSDTIDEPTKQYQMFTVHHNVSDGTVSSSLYINATIDNDGVTIGCRIVSFVPYDEDDEAAGLNVLRISPVRDVSLSIDGVPYVSWTIPSVIASDISVSNIRYTVTLEGGNITSTVTDIDDTHYEFTDMSISYCTNSSTVYTATVTAYDDTHHSYTSEDTTITNTTIDASNNTTLMFTERPTVLMYNNGSCRASFNISVRCACGGESIKGFTQFDENNSPKAHEKQRVNSDLVLYTTQLLNDIQDNAVFMVVAYGNNNELLAENETTFSTFHVQDFSISNAINGNINVTCMYAIGSTATGCRVDLMKDNYQSNITIPKDSFNITAVPDGTYSVTVYDVVGDSMAVAITTTTTINNIPVSTSALSTEQTTVMQATTTTTGSRDDMSSIYVVSTMELEGVPSTPVATIVGISIAVVAAVLIILAVCIVGAVFITKYHNSKAHDVIIRGELATIHKEQAKDNTYDVNRTVTLAHVFSQPNPSIIRDENQPRGPLYVDITIATQPPTMPSVDAVHYTTTLPHTVKLEQTPAIPPKKQVLSLNDEEDNVSDPPPYEQHSEGASVPVEASDDDDDHEFVSLPINRLPPNMSHQRGNIAVYETNDPTATYSIESTKGTSGQIVNKSGLREQSSNQPDPTEPDRCPHDPIIIVQQPLQDGFFNDYSLHITHTCTESEEDIDEYVPVLHDSNIPVMVIVKYEPLVYLKEKYKVIPR